MSRPHKPVPLTWTRLSDAARMFLRGATVNTGTRIALVVGTWLSLMNQGGPIVDGHPPWPKIALNYATPFLVSSLGFLAARRRRNVERLAALLADRDQ
ncbi:MAG TPA: hypothetical protein VF942_06080 [Acidimicrobiales bacterium]